MSFFVLCPFFLLFSYMFSFYPDRMLWSTGTEFWFILYFWLNWLTFECSMKKSIVCVIVPVVDLINNQQKVTPSKDVAVVWGLWGAFWPSKNGWQLNFCSQWTNALMDVTGSVTSSLLKQGGEHHRHRTAAPAVCSALEHRFLCCQRTVEPKCFQFDGVLEKRTVVPILLHSSIIRMMSFLLISFPFRKGLYGSSLWMFFLEDCM